MNSSGLVLKAQNLLGEKLFKKNQRVAQLVTPKSKSLDLLKISLESRVENELQKLIFPKDSLQNLDKNNYFIIEKKSNFETINPVSFNFEPIYKTTMENDLLEFYIITEPKFNVNWIKGKVQEGNRGGFGSTGF